MKLRYTRGDTGWLKSDKDVKALTTERGGALTTYDSFRVVGGSLSLVQDGGSCTVIVQFEYNA